MPKISTAEQIELIGQRLFDMHADLQVRLWAMIETPKAILNLGAIAELGRDPASRLVGFVAGTNDQPAPSAVSMPPGRIATS